MTSGGKAKSRAGLKRDELEKIPDGLLEGL